MNLNLKFWHRLVISVFIPVACLLSAIVALSIALHQSNNMYERERDARMAFSALNKIEAGLMMTAGNQALYFVTKDPQNKRAFDDGYKQFEFNRKHARLAFSRIKESAKEIAQLDQLLNSLAEDFKSAISAVEQEDKMESMVYAVRTNNSIRKTARLTNELYEQLDKRHSEETTIQERKIEQLYNIATFLSVASLIAALFGATTLIQVAAIRFGRLAENIQKLGIGDPLKKTMSGGDEIARLDSSLHKVSELLHEARRKEQSLIENAQDVICSLDRSGKIAQINQAATELWGFSKDELLGRHISSITYSADREATAESIQQLVASEINDRFENRIVCRDGRVADMIWNARWSTADDALFCVAHDITQRKQAERLKQEVVAMVSHDLRSPLTSILMTLDLLQGGGLGELSEKGFKRINTARMSANTLIELTNDLLDLEKIEAGMFSLDKRQISASTLFEDATSLLIEVANSKGLKIETESDGAKAIVDPDRMIRVITNLISNAIKFSTAGSTITLKAFQNNDSVQFEVIDQGRGIPEEEIAHVFERYSQVDKRDATEKKGSGLGLAICKALVEAHGGTIGVTSKPGEGSRFWFRVPIE